MDNMGDLETEKTKKPSLNLALKIINYVKANFGSFNNLIKTLAINGAADGIKVKPIN